MTIDMNIFVASDEDTETFAKNLQTILGIVFQPILDRENFLYGYSDGKTKWVNLRTHTYFDDFDLSGQELNYSQFQYELELGIYNVRVYDEQLIISFARDIFEKIRMDGRYQIMLVKNFEERLDHSD